MTAGPAKLRTFPPTPPFLLEFIYLFFQKIKIWESNTRRAEREKQKPVRLRAYFIIWKKELAVSTTTTGAGILDVVQIIRCHLMMEQMARPRRVPTQQNTHTHVSFTTDRHTVCIYPERASEHSAAKWCPINFKRGKHPKKVEAWKKNERNGPSVFLSPLTTRRLHK
jgi:hypothetical protein